MKFQDYIADAITKDVKDAFKYAREMPADKIAWKPLDQGRSALDQLQELAQAPTYVVGMLKGQKEEPSPDHFQKMMEERKAWDTVDKCQSIADKNYADLDAAIRSFPDEKLKDTVWLPYDGGRDFTMAEIMEYPRWNANYHQGQIAYIQTLYGDKEMR